MNKIPNSGSIQALEILIFHKSPNWSNFPTKIMNITIYQQTPLISDTKFGLNHQKPQKFYRFEIPKLKCMKCENKNKKKGKRVLPVFRERNLAKRRIKNDKNLRWSQVWIGEREKTWETFEKVFLKKSRFVFKKLDSRYSIDRKTVSINRTR